MKYTIQNTKHMTLAQCKRIKANQFRSADNSQDYCPFAIEERIIELQMKQELPEQTAPVIEFDYQLAALLPIGKYLLALIDYHFKTCSFFTKSVLVQNKQTKEKTMHAPTLYSIDDLVSEYKSTKSGHYFDKDTMRFFKSRLTSLFKRISDTEYLFVTTEKKCFNDHTRVHNVRKATIVPDTECFYGYKIKIETLDNYYQVSNYMARKVLKEYSHGK